MLQPDPLLERIWKFSEEVVVHLATIAPFLLQKHVVNIEVHTNDNTECLAFFLVTHIIECAKQGDVDSDIAEFVLDCCVQAEWIKETDWPKYFAKVLLQMYHAVDLLLNKITAEVYDTISGYSTEHKSE